MAPRLNRHPDSAVLLLADHDGIYRGVWRLRGRPRSGKLPITDSNSSNFYPCDRRSQSKSRSFCKRSLNSNLLIDLLICDLDFLFAPLTYISMDGIHCGPGRPAYHSIHRGRVTDTRVEVERSQPYWLVPHIPSVPLLRAHGRHPNPCLDCIIQTGSVQEVAMQLCAPFLAHRWSHLPADLRGRLRLRSASLWRA